MRIAPLEPTTQMFCGSSTYIPKRTREVPDTCFCQSAPPFVVLRITPEYPDAQAVLPSEAPTPRSEVLNNLRHDHFGDSDRLYV